MARFGPFLGLRALLGSRRPKLPRSSPELQLHARAVRVPPHAAAPIRQAALTTSSRHTPWCPSPFSHLFFSLPTLSLYSSRKDPPLMAEQTSCTSLPTLLLPPPVLCHGQARPSTTATCHRKAAPSPGQPRQAVFRWIPSTSAAMRGSPPTAASTASPPHSTAPWAARPVTYGRPTPPLTTDRPVGRKVRQPAQPPFFSVVCLLALGPAGSCYSMRASVG